MWTFLASCKGEQVAHKRVRFDFFGRRVFSAVKQVV